jgi:hypothetical protein
MKSLELKNTRMVITLVILAIGVVVAGFNLYLMKKRNFAK